MNGYWQVGNHRTGEPISAAELSSAVFELENDILTTQLDGPGEVIVDVEISGLRHSGVRVLALRLPVLDVEEDPDD